MLLGTSYLYILQVHRTPLHKFPSELTCGILRSGSNRADSDLLLRRGILTNNEKKKKNYRAKPLIETTRRPIRRGRGRGRQEEAEE